MQTVSLIVGATGHRPDKLGGYGRYNTERLIGIYERALHFYGATRAVTRLAQGSDQCFAQACIHADVPYDAIVPFPTESERWPHDAQRHYTYLLGRAARAAARAAADAARAAADAAARAAADAAARAERIKQSEDLLELMAACR